MYSMCYEGIGYVNVKTMLMEMYVNVHSNTKSNVNTAKVSKYSNIY